MHEIDTAFLHEKFHLSRRHAASVVTAVCLVLGAACSLSFGSWEDVRIFGMGFFELFDFLTAKFIMPLCSIFISIFVGWVLDRKLVRSELTNDNTLHIRAARFFVFLIRWVAPFGMSIIFLNELLS